MNLSEFRDFNSQLFNASTHLLVAVSGGIDSVVLCHLMQESGHRYEVAHCNFHLRGADSDRDEQFVRQLAERYGVACHVAQFDTRRYAAENGLSIEMAARKLRYHFFAQIIDSSNPNPSNNSTIQQLNNSTTQQFNDSTNALVLTANHRDDSIETFFLNLLRGTGITGLAGMRAVTVMTDTDPAIQVAHPLLPFSREEIVAYAEAQGLEHVEDVTNCSLEYRRNRIRHQLMPLLRDIVPGADKAIVDTMRHLADTDVIYRQALAEVRARVVTHRDGYDEMDIDALRSLQPLRSWLFELLRPYGFNAAQTADIQDALDSTSGRCFYSPTHRLVRERATLVVAPLQREASASQPPCQMKEWGREEYLQQHGSFRTTADRALFDADLLRQPLHWRHPRLGDRFQPFGMQGTRLLSDFFSDLKLPLHERESQWLLCDAEDTILWVAGRRADGRYAVTETTQRILEVSMSRDADWRF